MTEKKTILVGGTFDILHVGHLKFLKFAKAQATPSQLIVIIARDETVKKTSHHTPIFSENERKELVENLKMVDKAILGNLPGKSSFLDILTTVRPDIVVLGHDQFFNANKIEEWAMNHGLNLKVIRAREFTVEGLASSSAVRKKVREVENEE
ncbi:MAG: FAD synthase [Candidatus Korarchaeota archaeon]|nr:FAD synthase [Candidatus Korarchaeota archaeon]NIU85522.1 adenylyltransferase/cytidyltransferase family protein [Candidatus Thorarchaeota archaeon]NIW15635.1 adenylyltransferase/cytidyltransferase family protein [Candidatus Thorarchaeota archaeon]NIW53570.1 adenylyltransferase/cytidyltransferase family protein [Candidatus Korarchaeota archaeon]